ncbi:MAG: phosphoribosylformylglycinamidine cyclo-ligase [Alphaproteobacteria bacterium]|nr:phosphoribosylformylglycinamidine cyclo-ligase [Alphaproteobacteria bacterium]
MKSQKIVSIADAMNTDKYRQAGVDTDEAESGLRKLVKRIEASWPAGLRNSVRLPVGYYANVVEFNGKGLALCTDGVGSKTLIAQALGKFDTIGIDCVAMNVNDLICVGARPISFLDYVVVEKLDADFLDKLSIGLTNGAQQAGVSITGGETSQLKDIVSGFDLVGMAVGEVELDRVIVGDNLRSGDVIIGIGSNGIHSNGLTLARYVFFEKNNFDLDHRFKELDVSIGEELLKPTKIYVPEVLELLEQSDGIRALANITGDGLLNLTRVHIENISFVIENLLPIPPIFELIEKYGEIDVTEMFGVFNMGIGFCVVVDPTYADKALVILAEYDQPAAVIGHVIADTSKKVYVKQRNIVGEGKNFFPVNAVKETGSD